MLSSPRKVLAVCSLACIGLLAYGLYLQHGLGLEPCPMCIVQRYAMALIVVVAGLASVLPMRAAHIAGGALVFPLAGFGAFVAARQSWLQWYPPEVLSCGRDFYGMVETFPLKRAIPMIFRGGGDCTQVDWTFIGLSIANWSFLCFLALGALVLFSLFRSRSGA